MSCDAAMSATAENRNSSIPETTTPLYSLS
jgi:hypothetical protein